MTDAIKEKELTDIKHIEKATPDDCMCDLCAAVRKYAAAQEPCVMGIAPCGHARFASAFIAAPDMLRELADDIEKMKNCNWRIEVVSAAHARKRLNFCDCERSRPQSSREAVYGDEALAQSL